MLNIFIIGCTKVGKSSLAKMLAEYFKYHTVSASEWIRNIYKQDNLEEITKLSCQLLAKNSNACTDYIVSKYNVKNGGFIIEGIRNPKDFAVLFRPEQDIVIHLYYENLTTNFEQFGLNIINNQIDWFIENKILNNKNVFRCKLNSLFDNKISGCGNRGDIFGPKEYTPFWNIPELYEFLIKVISFKYHVHASIKEIPAFVENSVLYNNSDIVGWSKCKIIGISSYPGHAITFQIFINNESVFSYIPIHKLKFKEVLDQLNMSDLCYNNCVDENISISYFDLNQCSVYFKNLNKWIVGQYVLSIDWYKENDLKHLIKLENGQFALMPNHKINFNCEEKLPNYLKLKCEWKLPS